MKYIVTDDNDIIIFSNGLTHADVARKLQVQVAGAGFISGIGKDAQCYGKSVSLGIESRLEDQDVLLRHVRDY